MCVCVVCENRIIISGIHTYTHTGTNNSGESEHFYMDGGDGRDRDLEEWGDNFEDIYDEFEGLDVAGSGNVSSGDVCSVAGAGSGGVGGGVGSDDVGSCDVGSGVGSGGVGSDDVGSGDVGSGGVGSSDVGSGGVENGGEEDDLDTEQLVEEALSQIPPGADIGLELRPCDVEEEQKVDEFMSLGCGCKLSNGSPCSNQFTTAYVKDIRLTLSELTTTELDLVLMGQLMANSNTSDVVVTESRHSATSRKKAYTTFFHQGKRVCVAMFRFLHRIGKKRLFNVVESVRKNGVQSRVHGNTNRFPKYTLSLASVEYVVRFLLNYSEQHALLLPGRVPG